MVAMLLLLLVTVTWRERERLKFAYGCGHLCRLAQDIKNPEWASAAQSSWVILSMFPLTLHLHTELESKCHAEGVCFLSSLHLSRDFALNCSVSVSVGPSLSLYEHRVIGGMRAHSSLVAMITGHFTALMEARVRCWDTYLGAAGHLLCFPLSLKILSVRDVNN